MSSATTTAAPSAVRSEKVTWRWLWPLVFAAFALRIVAAFNSASPLHPDEVLQYLEQGHRLAFGYGFVPWEYSFGVRSWAIPIVIAGLLRFADVLGLSEPWLYIPFVETTFVALSLVLPVGLYRLGQILIGETGARIALLFGCFWGHFVLYAHKPMPSILATYALVWLAVWMLRPAGRGMIFAIGIVAGLAVMIRFQILPVAAALGLWGIFLYRWQVLWAYAGGTLVVVLAGLLDLWAWGGFLFSFVQNFRLNFLLNYSAELFGRHPVWFYAADSLLETGGVILLALPGLFFLPRQAWPVFAAVGLGVVALHVPEHKEFRFIIWALPFAFLSAAAFLAALLERRETVARIGGAAILAGSLAMGTAFMAVRAGWTPPGFLGEDWRVHAETEQVFFDLARDPDLTGVEVLTPHLRFWQTRGYYGLHRPVPYYAWGWTFTASDAEQEEARRFVSHVLTSDHSDGGIPPSGFERVNQVGRYTIWKAASLPAPSEEPEHFDFILPRHEELDAVRTVPADRIRPRLPSFSADGSQPQ